MVKRRCADRVTLWGIKGRSKRLAVALASSGAVAAARAGVFLLNGAACWRTSRLIEGRGVAFERIKRTGDAMHAGQFQKGHDARRNVLHGARSKAARRTDALTAELTAELGELSLVEREMVTLASRLIVQAQQCSHLSRAERASCEARSIIREIRARRAPAAAPGAALKADALEAYAATVRERERTSDALTGNARASS